MYRSRLFVVQLALLLCIGVSCAPAEEASERSVDEVSDELERLRALGYVGASEHVADAAESGVEVLDMARVSRGISLYTEPFHCSATLIDVEGQVLNTWSQDSCQKWMHAELLRNGDLLVPVFVKGARYVLRLNWEGDEIWRARGPVHHDAEETPSGDVLSITKRPRRLPGYVDGAAFLDNEIVRISAAGKVLEAVSLFDVLSANAIGYELPSIAARSQKLLDPFHTNSIEAMRRPELAARASLYSLDNVLISSRHLGAVLVVDMGRRELVWVSSPDSISSPHDARMLDNGNILLIENGTRRGWSRVVELDPSNSEVAWAYGSPDGDDFFFTYSRGSAQRLPNGNTLVAVSNEGEAFEIDPEGERVWKFWNPRLNRRGKREVIVRMIRYAPDYLLPRGTVSTTNGSD